MFLQCSVCPQGGHAWLLWGGVVAPGGCVWLLRGVACVVGPRGGMRGWSGGGHVWLVPGEGAWLVPGGMHGCSRGGADMHGIQRDTEIRSMSGRYASYWNAFLLFYIFESVNCAITYDFLFDFPIRVLLRILSNLKCLLSTVYFSTTIARGKKRNWTTPPFSTPILPHKIKEFRQICGHY